MSVTARASCDYAYQYGTCAASTIVPLGTPAQIVASLAAQGWSGGGNLVRCPGHRR